jgi:hypothetical protein
VSVGLRAQAYGDHNGDSVDLDDCRLLGSVKLSLSGGKRQGLVGCGAIKGTIRAGLSFAEIVDSGADVLDVTSAAPGPRGSLPLTAEMLRDSPSGDIFGLTQNAGMGWDPRELGRCAKGPRLTMAFMSSFAIRKIQTDHGTEFSFAFILAIERAGIRGCVPFDVEKAGRSFQRSSLLARTVGPHRAGIIAAPMYCERPPPTIGRFP